MLNGGRINMLARVYNAIFIFGVFYLFSIGFAQSLHYGVGMGIGFNASNLDESLSYYFDENTRYSTSGRYSVFVADRNSSQFLGYVGYNFFVADPYRASMQLDAAWDSLNTTLFQSGPATLVQLKTYLNLGGSLRVFSNTHAPYAAFILAGLRATSLEMFATNFNDSAMKMESEKKMLIGPEIGLGCEYALKDAVTMRLEYKYFFGGKSPEVSSVWYLDKSIFGIQRIYDVVRIHQQSVNISFIF